MDIHQNTIKFLLLLFLSLNTPILSSLSQDSHLSYTQDQITASFELTMKKDDIREFNISITNDNKSLTVIIEILDNSGPLWGFFLEKASNYLPLNQSLTALASCCTKYSDHVAVYTVVQMVKDPDPNYILAFYNTHAHASEDTHFKATFLKGIIGSEINVQNGPTPIQALLLYLVFPIGTITIGSVIVIQLLKIRNSRKLKEPVEELLKEIK